MVIVPIDNQDPSDTVLLLEISGGDRNIIKDAEAHASIGSRVMARRTHCRKRILQFSGHDGVYDIQDSAGGELCRFERSGGNERIARAELAHALQVCQLPPHNRNIRRFMDQLQLLIRDAPRRYANKIVQEPGLCQAIADRGQPLRPFGMTGVAGDVLEIDVVEKQARLCPQFTRAE